MMITPLVVHAAVQIPKWTGRFSDTLPVTSITVVEGGTVTITCSSPHGVPIGRQTAVSITDADMPNAITAASVLPDGNIAVTVTNAHDLTTTPNPDRYAAWNETVKLTGFSNANLNGNRRLVGIVDDATFVVQPGAAVGSILLTGNEKLLERLEVDVVGWHAVTAATSTTLTFPTPETVTRSYTVANPVVVTSIRIYGAATIDDAIAQFSPEDGLALDKAHLFILPLSAVRVSRSGTAKTDAIAEIGPGTAFRQLMLDGFTVAAIVPSGNTVAHVRAIDLCNGEVLKAVNRTFLGLKLPRPELADAGGPYAAILESHTGGLTQNRAFYIHVYEFQSPAYLTNADAIAPYDWASFDVAALVAAQDGLAAGQPLPDALTSVPPTGTVSFRGLDFTGILHDSKPQPLTATVIVDIET